MQQPPKTAHIPIGITPGTRILQLRYEYETSTYIVWLHHDLLMQHGTFLRLHGNGLVQRITLRPDGSEEINTVMEARVGNHN